VVFARFKDKPEIGTSHSFLLVFSTKMGKNADNSKEGQPIKDYGVEDVVDL